MQKEITTTLDEIAKQDGKYIDTMWNKITDVFARTTTNNIKQKRQIKQR